MLILLGQHCNQVFDQSRLVPCFVCECDGSANVLGYARLVASVLCQRLVPTIICVVLCVHFIIAKMLVPTVCFTLPKPIQDELFGICAFRCQMLNIPMQIVTRVCGTLLSLRDRFLYCPLLVSNFLSHTAQFSTRRKVWKRICSL